MALTGDFAKLAALRGKVRSLGSGDFRTRLANVLGAEALTQLQLGFRESRNPYGQGWAPLKIRSGGKPLLDTGRLRSSYSYNATATGFRLGTNFIGAPVHQHGATITPKNGKFLRFKGKVHGRGRKTTPWIYAREVTIPRRQMVPEGSLGPIWNKAFDEAATRFLSKLLKS